MKDKLEKVLSVGLVLVMIATVFSVTVRNMSACGGGEKDIESLNPDVATNEYTHIVWQENLTGNFEIYYVNNATGNYENTLKEAICIVENLTKKSVPNLQPSMSKEKIKVEKKPKPIKPIKDPYKEILKGLNKALEECSEKDYRHSMDKVHEAVKDLEKAGNTELIISLIDSVRDFAKTNIFYLEYNLTINNSYIQEAYQKYYLAIEKYEQQNYDAAINQFKNSYLKLLEAWEEAYEEENKCENNDDGFVGIDFGKIVKISYTNFDSVNPQIFLNGTISVGWKEIMDNVSNVYYARSSNRGISWWYFDATEHANTYLCYAGIDPNILSIENMLTITRTLERTWIIDGCHYLYAPIIKDGFTIEDRKVYAPINDPYLTIYDGKYEPINIGDKKFYIICGPGPLPVPPPKASDLTVSGISFSNNHPLIEENIIVYASIKNEGNASVSGSLTVSFYDENKLIENATLNSVPAGGVDIASIEWVTSLPVESHLLRVVVNKGNELPEGDTSNNENSRLVYSGFYDDFSSVDNWKYFKPEVPAGNYSSYASDGCGVFKILTVNGSKEAAAWFENKTVSVSNPIYLKANPYLTFKFATEPDIKAWLGFDIKDDSGNSLWAGAYNETISGSPFRYVDTNGQWLIKSCSLLDWAFSKGVTGGNPRVTKIIILVYDSGPFADNQWHWTKFDYIYLTQNAWFDDFVSVDAWSFAAQANLSASDYCVSASGGAGYFEIYSNDSYSEVAQWFESKTVSSSNPIYLKANPYLTFRFKTDNTAKSWLGFEIRDDSGNIIWSGWDSPFGYINTNGEWQIKSCSLLDWAKNNGIVGANPRITRMGIWVRDYSSSFAGGWHGAYFDYIYITQNAWYDDFTSVDAWSFAAQENLSSSDYHVSASGGAGYFEIYSNDSYSEVAQWFESKTVSSSNPIYLKANPYLTFRFKTNSTVKSWLGFEIMDGSGNVIWSGTNSPFGYINTNGQWQIESCSLLDWAKNNGVVGANPRVTRMGIWVRDNSSSFAGGWHGAWYDYIAIGADTDGDTLSDWVEVNGLVTRYVVDKDEKGYLFYIPWEMPVSYNKVFTYHTDPLNPDTDGDGQNDYNDLIPLDYDMDGDGKINLPALTDPNSPFYVERLATAANNDPNLQKNTGGSFVEDTDVDNDGTNNYQDTDLDADGMPDMYEIKYGCVNSDMSDPDTPGGYVSNAVQGQGWQHPYIYNARYAVVIVGGGANPPGASTNDVISISDVDALAFWNDGMELYNKLASDYRYIDENIYLLHSHGWRNGERDWRTDLRWDGEATIDDIHHTFKTLKDKMTINDFFFFAEICHGSGWTFNNAFHEYCWFGPYTNIIQYNLSEGLDSLTPARMCIVLQSCYSGGGIDDLSKEDRIVISASKSDELSYGWKNSYIGGPSPEESAEHWEFLYNEDGNGFLRNFGNSQSPNSVLDMYYSGYDAARDDDWGGGDDTSHPLLEDCRIDGTTGHEKSQLSENDPNKDGYLAKRTFL